MAEWTHGSSISTFSRLPLQINVKIFSFDNLPFLLSTRPHLKSSFLSTYSLLPFCHLFWRVHSSVVQVLKNKAWTFQQ
jgi:hypothetical protein